MTKQQQLKMSLHQESKKKRNERLSFLHRFARRRATIIQPNRATFGFVHQQAVQSPPLIRGTFSDVIRHSPLSTSESQVSRNLSMFYQYEKSIVQDDSILISSIQNARITNQSIRSLLNGNVPLSSLIVRRKFSFLFLFFQHFFSVFRLNRQRIRNSIDNC